MSFHLYSSDIDALSSFIVTTSTDLTERTRLVSEAVKNVTELQAFKAPEQKLPSPTFKKYT